MTFLSISHVIVPLAIISHPIITMWSTRTATLDPIHNVDGPISVSVTIA